MDQPLHHFFYAWLEQKALLSLCVVPDWTGLLCLSYLLSKHSWRLDLCRLYVRGKVNDQATTQSNSPGRLPVAVSEQLTKHWGATVSL